MKRNECSHHITSHHNPTQHREAKLKLNYTLQRWIESRHPLSLPNVCGQKRTLWNINTISLHSFDCAKGEKETEVNSPTTITRNAHLLRWIRLNPYVNQFTAVLLRVVSSISLPTYLFLTLALALSLYQSVPSSFSIYLTTVMFVLYLMLLFTTMISIKSSKHPVTSKHLDCREGIMFCLYCIYTMKSITFLNEYKLKLNNIFNCSFPNNFQRTLIVKKLYFYF